uniref:Uncharacterized protein n=1 Tax=Candidatus Kentrum eta TaxID=2126337 RepID=A0A450UH42_9GAMM|nr:MAG: hypothetical protein BECKH772A_GA0070896_100242 [Candidatus Kentron sp. H]VFJ91839.1 MAG: hypothetical protein BECKH772B_GA0070898_100222 [Candidatus Kentron sp. H]VFJ98512.1 MAG: hypothetical protein BECKH772C_GA0070978_100222 [Candidatus Kentron sp. H]
MDKRYTKQEIVDLCQEAGLAVRWAKYTGAGKWRESLSPTEDAAKEIRVFCGRRQNP